MKFNTKYDRKTSKKVIFESMDYDTVVTDPTGYVPIRTLIDRFTSGSLCVNPNEFKKDEYDFQGKESEKDMDNREVDPEYRNDYGLAAADDDVARFQREAKKLAKDAADKAEAEAKKKTRRGRDESDATSIADKSSNKDSEVDDTKQSES